MAANAKFVDVVPAVVSVCRDLLQAFDAKRVPNKWSRTRRNECPSA